MTTRNKILLLLTGFLGTAVLFFIFFYFSVPKLINSEVVKKKVNAYFLEKTGGSLVLKKSDIHLFPLPHIVFQQVSISIPNKANGLIQSLSLDGAGREDTWEYGICFSIIYGQKAL